MNEAQVKNMRKLMRSNNITELAAFVSNEKITDEAIKFLSNNKDYKIGLQIVQVLKIDSGQFPGLVVRARKTYVRFSIKNCDYWEQLEVRLAFEKILLVYLVEDLYNDFLKNSKSKYFEQSRVNLRTSLPRNDFYRNLSFSIVKRNNLYSFLEKVELRRDYNEDFEFLDNRLLSNNQFGRVISSQ